MTIEVLLNLCGLLLITLGGILAARSTPAPQYGPDGSVSVCAEQDHKKRIVIYNRQSKFKWYLYIIAIGAFLQAIALLLPELSQSVTQPQVNSSLALSVTDKVSILELVQNVMVRSAWIFDAIGLVLILAVRMFSNTKSTWGGIGFLLIIIAVGNAAILVAVQLNPSQQLASIIGLGVLGALGTRFVGNWLTEGAT